MATKTWTWWPIVAVLVKIEDMLGTNRTWTAVNARQEDFLKDFFAKCRGELGKLAEQLTSVVDTAVGPVNKFLADRGFDIQLEDQGPRSLYAASVFDLLLDWLAPGKKIDWRAQDGFAFDAVKLKSLGQATFNPVYMLGDTYSNEAVQITASNGDVVHLIKDRRGSSGRNILGVAIAQHGLTVKSESGNKRYEEIIFPMVTLDQQVDISWLQGLHTCTDNLDFYEIAQALQQTKVRMNHLGVRVESAVAVSVRFMALATEPPTRFVIDEPFWLVIERPGVKQPLFVGFMDRDCWKNPGSLK